MQIDRRDSFDQVVIETTGLADPQPIIATLRMSPDLQEDLVLDGVITLVDAKHIEQHLDEKKPEGALNEAEDQIAYADRILLNKTDLVRFAGCILLNQTDLVRLVFQISASNWDLFSISTTCAYVEPQASLDFSNLLFDSVY